MSENALNISDWIHEIIDGVGGLHDFEYYEMATPTIPRDEAVAAWVLRCLANVKCEGSDLVLGAIQKRRDDKTQAGEINK